MEVTDLASAYVLDNAWFIKVCLHSQQSTLQAPFKVMRPNNLFYNLSTNFEKSKIFDLVLKTSLYHFTQPPEKIIP